MSDSINIVHGNLIDVVESGTVDPDRHIVVLQNCNCQCRMGAGMAKDIAYAWPEAEAADNQTRRGDSSKLGNWSTATVNRPGIGTFTVLNLYCQDRYGPAHERHFDEAAFKECLRKIGIYYRGQRIHFVFGLIGTGHAGGRWSTNCRIIEVELGGYPKTLVKLPSPGGWKKVPEHTYRPRG
jgi:O-acetyl-ADP-ribose deacetylase (regulator of RNase III)